MDVTDRMSLPRNRSTISRENSALSASANSKEFDVILNEVKPLAESSSLSPKAVDEIMQSAAKIIGDASVDWKKRINSLKQLRSLCADPIHHAQIVAFVRHLVPPMQNAVKDLRSQVGRESCITVAFFAKKLGNKGDIFADLLLNTLFSLLVANAKIVSLTGTLTITTIYDSVHSYRLIPPLLVQMQHKSKDVRRVVCMAAKIVLKSWPSSIINRSPQTLQEVIRKGLTDADAETRVSARECFPPFQQRYPDLASTVSDSLDGNQRRQLDEFVRAVQSGDFVVPPVVPRTNGVNSGHTSLSRQGSFQKKTSIPVLASRASPSPARTPGSGRSSSAIDLQAANRARQQHFSYNTMSSRKTPLRYMGRTNSSVTSPTGNAANHTYGGHSSFTPNSSSHMPNTPASATPDQRSRTRSRISSRLSHSQPGSRSSSPSSKFAYATYTSPYAQQGSSAEGSFSPLSPPGAKGLRRFSATSSASSSRDSSPQGRYAQKRRTRSITHSPQVFNSNNSSSVTAKLLNASREAENNFGDMSSLPYKRDEVDLGNHSDSEDSMSSHRSYLSETFSPSGNPNRHLFVEDVEELINKCGSAKWSERKEGLLGIQHYLQRHGSLPPQYFNRIGQTFCRIFMDAHTKVLSLFLDVLHDVLYRHAKDLVDFTNVLFNRILTKLGSDLLSSVHSKLMKTLEIIMEEMPADLQFSSVAHYLCDPTQTPNARSRVAALCHLYNLSAMCIPVNVDELLPLVEKILDWCSDSRSHELRRTSQRVFYSLFDMAAPQMTLVLSQLPPSKQDKATAILRTEVPHRSPVHKNSSAEKDASRVNALSGWSSIHSDMESLKISQSNMENGLEAILAQMTISPGGKKGPLVPQLLKAIKQSPDGTLIERHRELLKILFDTLGEDIKRSEKSQCFNCLEELCKKRDLSPHLAEFAELFIVRVTDAQSAQTPREISKSAENCGMAIAAVFPPESLVRALCPIVQNREFPVNQMAIKMLHRLSECCEISKLRAVCPDVLTTLIGAYDHVDSAVRKAAVFAIVAVYMRLGDELQPYLNSLSGSKLKLLQLYIQRAQQNSNGRGGS